MIVYFSGTGNSRYVAQALSHALDEPVHDAGSDIKTGHPVSLTSETPWIFVAPTYGWRLPRIFTAFLRKAAFSGSQEVYFVMTCGSDIGNAGYWNGKLCQELHLTDRGTLGVLMPENYIALFSAPDQEEAQAIIDEANPTLATIAEYIRKGLEFPSDRITVLDRMKSSVVNRAFYQLVIKSKPFHVKDTCVGCRDCVQACPLNNIKLVDKRPVWGDQCTHCMACICGCPKSAIEYGKKSQGKPRYQCPDYYPPKDETASVRP